LTAKEGWAASQGKSCVVALHTELTPELIREGIAKDAIRLIQDLRKKRQCNFTDRIAVTIVAENSDVRQALEENREFICGETLSVRLTLRDSGSLPDSESAELTDTPVTIHLETVG